MRFFTKHIAILFLLISTLLIGCSDESPSPARDYHQLNSYAVSNIVATSATFNAEIIAPGTEPILEHGFTWGKTRPFADDKGFGTTKLGSRSGTGKFTATVEYAFDKSATYYVRPFVKTENTIVYGNIVAFRPKS